MSINPIGLGRGLGKGWLGNFKPKPVPITIEQIVEALKNDTNNLRFFSNAHLLNSEDIGHKKKLSSSSESTGERATPIVVPDEKPTPKVVPDEKPTIKADGKEPDFKLILEKAVYANEFVPVAHKNIYVPSDEKPLLQRQFSDTPGEEKAQHVLMDHVMTLTENPGEFDHVIYDLTSMLSENITTVEMLKESIFIIFDQAISFSNFSYSAARLFEFFDLNNTFKLEHGQFRKTFYERCKTEFTSLQKRLSEKVKLPSNDITKICNVAILFGELYNNMKLKDRPNPLFKKVIGDIVGLFLQSKEDDLIRCLVKLLKLVGPEMDADRPKDVEDMFNKVRDFYLSPESCNLSESVRMSIWHVYKLHTRDWDRCTSPVIDLQYQSHFEVYDGTSRKASSSDIDWNDYYQGEDESEFSSKSGDDEDHFNDFEEFLRETGQI